MYRQRRLKFNYRTIISLNFLINLTRLLLCSLERIADYRFFLSIRNETYDIFDSTLHPIETTILELRIVASNKSGLPLSAFRLITDKSTDLLDHFRLSQYEIGGFFFSCFQQQ